MTSARLREILLAILPLGLGLTLLGGFGARAEHLRQWWAKGIEAAKGYDRLPLESTPWSDLDLGISVPTPQGFRRQVSGQGVHLVSVEEPSTGVLVTLLRQRRTANPRDVIERMARVWATTFPLESAGLTLTAARDEGATASAVLSGLVSGVDLQGEASIERLGSLWRVQALWCRRSDFNQERARLEGIARAITYSEPRPWQGMALPLGRAAQPDGFAVTASADGLEVVLRSDPATRVGMAAGPLPAGIRDARWIVDQFLTRSRGLTRPSSGSETTYPELTDAGGTSWRVTARELEYHTDGVAVRSVVTSAISTPTSRFLLAVRQAPHVTFDKLSLTLEAIQASMRLPPGAPTGPWQRFPLTHPAGSLPWLVHGAWHHAWTGAGPSSRGPKAASRDGETRLAKANRRAALWPDPIEPELAARVWAADEVGHTWWWMPVALARPDGPFPIPGSAGALALEVREGDSSTPGGP